MTSAPLSGIRVLDMTTYLAGPLATRVLADLGATVLKVEPPTGDVTRAGWRRGDDAGGASFYWRALHGGRRSVAIDLASEDGREQLLNLAGSADVVVDNLRPGVTARFGVDGPSLRPRFPQLITCAITGFDPDDELAGISATDGPVQAWAGSVDLMKRWCGVELPMPLQAGDIAGGSAAAQGVLAALFDRSRTGVGRHVQVSLVGALTQWLAVTDRQLTLSPPTTLVLTGCDGVRFLVQTPLRFAAVLLQVLGLPPDLPREQVADTSAEVAATDTGRAWLDKLWAAGIPAAPVRQLGVPDEAPPQPPWTFDGDRAPRRDLHLNWMRIGKGSGSEGEPGMAAFEVKAWHVEAHGHPREVMRLRDVPVPEPGPGQVAIKTSAVALNLPDTRLCFGTYTMKPQLPFTPGFDVAGQIIAVGAGVDPTLVGTPAIGVAGPPDGALAEVALVRAGALYELPDDIPAGDAVALLIPFTTGQLALHRRGRLQQGETLLVHAGTGGVGSAAIQLGVLAGARVLATAGGPEKVALCRELGAEQAYDYRALDSTQLIAAVREATGGRGADVIYDSVGGDIFHASRKMIASEGRLLVVGFASGDVAQAPTNQTLMANYDIVGVYFGAYGGPSSDDWRRNIWAQILDHYRAGRLRPLRDRTMTALDDDVAGAVADLGERRTTGRVVLEF